MKRLICTVCDDEVGLGGQLLPTGPLCAECSDKSQETTSPTNNQADPAPAVVEPVATAANPEAVPVAPRAAEEGEQGSAPTRDRDGDDRVLVENLNEFDPPPTRNASLEVEEWLVAGEQVITPERYVSPEIMPGGAPCKSFSVGTEISRRFVVVLEWWRRGGSRPAFRRTGPSFTPRAAADRPVALRAAREWAGLQAKKLKVVGPFGYWPAREI